MYLPTLTDEELHRYARDNAKTDLEKELAKRLEEKERRLRQMREGCPNDCADHC